MGFGSGLALDIDLSSISLWCVVILEALRWVLTKCATSISEQ